MLALVCMWLGGLLMGVGGTMIWMSYHSYDFTEVLLSLNGAKYCMTHEVMDTTTASEVKHLDALIEELEGR